MIRETTLPEAEIKSQTRKYGPGGSALVPSEGTG